MWIDKTGYQWVKIEAETTETISWGIFLARLNPGAKLVFEQTRVNDEVWLPRRQWMRGSGRIGLLKKLAMEDEITWSGYRKFQAESKIVVGPPVTGYAISDGGFRRSNRSRDHQHAIHRFRRGGRIVRVRKKNTSRFYPQPGWVEHDPDEIWFRTRQVAEEAMQQSGLQPRDLAAIGITNQRETTVLWNRGPGGRWRTRWSGRIPAWGTWFPSIRATPAVPDRFRAQTGLPLATYFSGLEDSLGAGPCRRRTATGRRGRGLFGTIDSFLVWHLTGTPHHRLHQRQPHAVDESGTLDWDPELFIASVSRARSCPPSGRAAKPTA